MIQDRAVLPVGQGHPYLRNREALERMQADMDALGLKSPPAGLDGQTRRPGVHHGLERRLPENCRGNGAHPADSYNPA